MKIILTESFGEALSYVETDTISVLEVSKYHTKCIGKEYADVSTEPYCWVYCLRESEVKKTLIEYGLGIDAKEIIFPQGKEVYLTQFKIEGGFHSVSTFLAMVFEYKTTLYLSNDIYNRLYRKRGLDRL